MAEIFDLDPVDDNNTGRWPEGMLGGTINNSARADEGMLARWYRDMNGSVVASGAVNTFAVTSVRTITSLFDNLALAFTANAAITGAATLNLNGLGAKAIKRFNGNALASGDIVSGQPVLVVYKSSPDVWFMVSALAALTGNMFADFAENGAPGNPVADTGRLSAFDDSGTTMLRYGDSGGTFRELMGRATKAQLQAAADLRQSGAVGLMHHHPGVAKAWGRGASAGGISGTAYGITSIVRTGLGAYTVTLAAAMDSTDYHPFIQPGPATSGGGNMSHQINISSTTVFTVTLQRAFDGDPRDADFSVTVFGKAA